jgi:dihydroorotate dehydrogenase electron transfer subunit/dihydroorotate dehydrogenase (NAD+) catalytic subunit
MTQFFKLLMEELSQTKIAGLRIRSPFTIPSGVVTTVPSVIARIAKEIPEIGFLTTKTLSVAPREGYREPVIHEYYPGCFVNAVGLANPGAADFVRAMRPLLPLHDNKPLVVSIMGKTPEEFLKCALILDEIADAFELNLSCPHVKGAGQNIGSDPEAVAAILRLLTTKFDKPIIPKLSPNLGDIPGMARLCESEGANALCLINTVGPGMAVDPEGAPVLTNVVGGLSGSGILPVGLKAVKETASAVRIPIIAAGGISSPNNVTAYMKAGASLFAVGSALAGMTTLRIAAFFSELAQSLKGDGCEASSACPSPITRTLYHKTKVTENVYVAGDMFKLSLEDGPSCDPGRFFFLRLPGVGEKPFSPAHDTAPVYLVRAVGPFTRALEALKPGDMIQMRGPYGRGFPVPVAKTPLVLIGGGTGSAPVLLAARRWKDALSNAFFGFSHSLAPDFERAIQTTAPGTRIAIDPPGRVGEVVRALEDNVRDQPEIYANCRVFICGPVVMMKAAAHVLSLGGVTEDRIFIAREDIMRCGIGLCGSCGTETGLRSCTDGPVIDLRE